MSKIQDFWANPFVQVSSGPSRERNPNNLLYYFPVENALSNEKKTEAKIKGGKIKRQFPEKRKFLFFLKEQMKILTVFKNSEKSKVLKVQPDCIKILRSFLVRSVRGIKKLSQNGALRSHS